MATRVLRQLLGAVLAAAFLAPPVQADIYTWVDPSGTINVSNLPPPEGAKVTSTVQERPPEVLAREAAARDAARQAEAQVLAERVRRLESEVELAKRPAPPADYAPAPAPPVIQYIFAPQPPVVQYIVNEAPAPASSWCDAGWSGCGPGWWPGFYPASVFVLPATGRGRLRPEPHGRGFSPFAPVRTSSFIQPLATPVVPPLAPPRMFEGPRKG